MKRNLKVTKTLSGVEINEEEFFTWLDALRSGKYSQTQMALQDHYGYCCLGVACKVIIPEDKQLVSIGDKLLVGGIPNSQPNSADWLNAISADFTCRAGTPLIFLNDHHNYSFEDIANCLEDIYVLGLGQESEEESL